MSEIDILRSEAAPAGPSKRDLIVSAALKLFLKSGYGATSMDSIAQEAGVSKQTVYSHHNTKKALFSAVIGEMCRAMGGPSAGGPPLEGPPDRALGQFGRKMLEMTRQPEAMAVFRVILAESHKIPELAEVLWEHGHLEMKQVLADYLAEQQRRGVLDLSDPDLAAEQFMGMVKYPHLLPTLLGTGPVPSEAEIARTVDQAVRLFLVGTRRN